MSCGEDEIEIHRVEEVRVACVRDDPETVVIQIAGPKDTRHYSLRRADLAALGKRLTDDARLLEG